MKTKTILANVALALTLGVFYTGCDKKTDDLIDTDTSSANDNSSSENAASEMFKSVSEVSDNDASLRATPCYTVTVSPIGASFPKTITIDFGSGGCGTKQGKIIAVLTGRFRTAGTVVTITTNNFIIGTDTIDAGVHTLTNSGNNLAGHQVFNISVSGATVKKPGGTASWNATRTIEWIEGDATPTDPKDDVYLISGNASGTSVKGVTYTASTDPNKPLRIALACQWIESGAISLTPNGKKTRTIDFGTSGCDNKATVTIDGKTYNVTM